MKKIAIVHDYIKEYGGAETVLLNFHKAFPNAPIYTLIYAPKFLGPHRKDFEKLKIIPSFLNKIPFSYKLISIFRIIAPFVFRTFNFSEFDIVLTSATGAYSPNILNKKNAKLISYYHTPPRYLYGFATARKQTENPIIKFLTLLVFHILRLIDFKASQNVDLALANSKNTAERISKFYRKKAVVVYPPVNILIKKNKKPNPINNYYLAGGRLARPKHIDLIIETCQKLNLPLKIFGRGFAGYSEELRSKSQEADKLKNRHLSSPVHNSKIEFLGEVTDQEKFNLMTNAKAYIFAAEDEDFGITPVEAMACGIPVIAYKSGGVLETIIDGITGIFFNRLTAESLTSAIEKFEKIKFTKEAICKQAKKFNTGKFSQEIKKAVYL